MKKSWKSWIFSKAVPALKKQATPLPLKELAFRAVRFAAACGRSHPISFALRPIAASKRLRTVTGLLVAGMALFLAGYGPLPAGAGDWGGQVSLTVASDGEVPLSTKPGVRLPLRTVEISQKFWLLHPGLDMRAPMGEPIRPIMAGRVKMAEKSWFGYGNMVIVTHSGEYESLYGHLSKISVTKGQEVGQDTIIGDVGSTGRSTGPHLHLEIHENGKSINPALILGI